MPDIQIPEESYRAAVKFVPIAILVATFVVIGFVEWGPLDDKWPGRMGALCVATGVFAGEIISRVKYRIEDGHLVPDKIPIRQAVERNADRVWTSSNVFFGTILWAFGDLLF